MAAKKAKVESEAVLQKRFIKRVRAAGAIAYKMDSQKGWPDWLIIWPGYPPEFVELKTIKGVVSPLQRKVFHVLGASDSAPFCFFGWDQMEGYLEARGA